MAAQAQGDFPKARESLQGCLSSMCACVIYHSRREIMAVNSKRLNLRGMKRSKEEGKFRPTGSRATLSIYLIHPRYLSHHYAATGTSPRSELRPHKLLKLNLKYLSIPKRQNGRFYLKQREATA